MSSVAQAIEDRLAEGLDCDHFELVNESVNHNVPSGSESHFKLTVVSASFAGERLIARHRKLNGLMRDLLAGPIHALALHTYTPDEWAERSNGAPLSPPCLGGGRGGDKAPGGQA